jgi:hypothetical protein
MMVQSRPHHLRHQWSQISTVVFILFLNHIHHHTYFNSSYVHIQVFPILHHHIMKLLLAFKSFLPRRLIVGIGSENWFAAGAQFGSENWFACGLPNSAARIGSPRAASSAARIAPLLAPQFRCTTHNSAANIISVQEVQLRQRNRISLRNTQIGSEY